MAPSGLAVTAQEPFSTGIPKKSGSRAVEAVLLRVRTRSTMASSSWAGVPAVAMSRRMRVRVPLLTPSPT